MSFDEDTTEWTLGLIWNCYRDTFKLSVKENLLLRVKTKRELLSISSKIYDPLGFLSSVKLTPKLLFQETCRQKIHWDDPLDESLVDVWGKWVAALPALTRVEVPRCLQPSGMKSYRLELHTFSDASEYAHGAVSYLRYVGEDRAVCSLIMAKSNLAPIRPSTIQRMELYGALTAARLSYTLMVELKMDFSPVVFWKDSTTVLRLINSEKLKFKAYVGARVAESLELTLPEQWHYVPTDLNPADDARRGILLTDLSIDHRWFSGPQFLTLVPDQWPVSPIAVAEIDSDPELRAQASSFVTVITADRIDALLNSVSQVNRLLRATVYVLRWIEALKRSPKLPRNGQISVEELRSAREYLIRHDQLLAFGRELTRLRAGLPLSPDSLPLSLRPFIDSKGILRVGGRLSRAAFPADVRQPILLPYRSRLTRLIIEDAHRPRGCLTEHLSKQETLLELRRTYWVPRGRQTVNKIVHDCIRCKAKRGITVTPVMADLPMGRLQRGSPAFSHTGVDYFGPFEVVILCRKVKRWLVLIVCLSTRAVHLEVVYTMTTDSFLASLWRFEARRGVPSTYYSDNCTYFVGAVNELSESLRNLEQNRIKESLARRGVVWRFNPPGAPHFGSLGAPRRVSETRIWFSAKWPIVRIRTSYAESSATGAREPEFAAGRIYWRRSDRKKGVEKSASNCDPLLAQVDARISSTTE